MRGASSEKRTTLDAQRSTIIDIAISFSKETGAYLVLKGVPTIVAEPLGNAFINTTGNPGMATAGSGDVLTGIISSFLGQGLNPVDASISGVYLHGLAGDIAADYKGEHSLIASDIVNFLPDALCRMTRDLNCME
jgi:NAD(P)H-hydrate epimerase